MSEGYGGTGGELERRIGDTERDAATQALIAHREAGRLDATEFEDRQVQVARSRTWAEIQPLFQDLPEPRPAGMPDVAPPSPRPLVPSSDAQSAAAPSHSEGLLGKVVPEQYRSTVMALTPFAALLLFFLTPGRGWLWFLAIPIVGILLYGTDDKDERRRKERRWIERERRREG